MELKGLNSATDKDCLEQDQNITHANDNNTHQTAVKQHYNIEHPEI